ncbi:MAG: response regulator [Treponema sp.]|jgi:signal transduction histidine kinase/CheY-like chemotaxis protein|nr:response regulator [Treponema sp.]
MKRGPISVKQHNTSRYSPLTVFLVPLAILIFGIFRISSAIYLMEFKNAVIAGSFNAAAIILVILFRRFNRFFNPAFVEPMLLFSFYVFASLLMGTFSFFFLAGLVICCIAALYLNNGKLLQYIFFSNLVTLVLVIFKIPMMNPERVIPLGEILVNWVLVFFGSVFIYLVTKISSEKTRRSSNTRDYLISLLSTTPNIVVLLDSLNQVSYLSNSFAKMIHLDNPQIAKGRPLLDLFQDAGLKDMFGFILEMENSYEDIMTAAIDGKQIYFKVIAGKLSNKTMGYQINMVDITQEMTAKIEAENASRSKSAFLATMSHEIRTPLNAIIGLSEIELQKKLPEDTRMDLEKIYNSGSTLLGIINDILDISKIEADNFALAREGYDTPSLINDAVQLNIVRIGPKRIDFKLLVDEMIPVRLCGDELRVKQILNNLLSNAFKYTDCGSVTLRIDWEKKDNDAWLIFTVSDTGHGIKKESLGKVFDKYTQFDNRANRNVEGTGLGLPITKNLVERMDGTITVESEYGKGSVFTVRIRQEIIDPAPLGKETVESLQQNHFMNKKLLNRSKTLIRSYMPYGKVLIVDDVETNLDVAKGLMLPYGLTIECASSGREAIEKIRELEDDPAIQKYDVIFMDHMMPEMDGVETARAIRNTIDTEYARTVPIIALTANALSGNEAMFLVNGFNAYISKPIDIIQMDLTLKIWIRDKQNEEVLKKAELEWAAKTETRASSPTGILDGLWVEDINLTAGRERYNNDATFLEIVRSYCVHTPALLEKIRDFSKENLHLYTVSVHGLKGSSYGICADEIGKYAEAMEMAAKAEDMEILKEKNSGLIEKTEKLLKSLNEILQNIERKNETKPRAAAPNQSLLIKLLEGCKRYKLTLMEEALTELEKYNYDTDAELVTWLRREFDNLEYDNIRKRLEKNG